MTRIGSLCDDTQCAGVARVPPTPDSQPQSSEHDSVVQHARVASQSYALIVHPSGEVLAPLCVFLYWCKLVSEFLEHGVITLEIFR